MLADFLFRLFLPPPAESFSTLLAASASIAASSSLLGSCRHFQFQQDMIIYKVVHRGR